MLLNCNTLLTFDVKLIRQGHYLSRLNCTSEHTQARSYRKIRNSLLFLSRLQTFVKLNLLHLKFSIFNIISSLLISMLHLVYGCRNLINLHKDHCRLSIDLALSPFFKDKLYLVYPRTSCFWSI